MRKSKKIVALLLTVAMVTGVFAGCGKDKGDTIVVASKNYNEALILGHMFASLIANNTDLNVERKLNLGGTNVAFEAITNDKVDIYPEYTGTGYVTIMKRDAISDTQKVYDEMKKYYNDELNISVLEPLGFNSTYAMAVRKDTAEKYNLKTCSDLAKVSGDLILGSTIEFVDRPDGYVGLKNVYGMNFKDTKAVDGGLRYKALANKNSDVIDAFATEGLLKVYDLVVLKDDKNFFPPYYAVPIVRNEIIEKHPEVQTELNKLAGLIDEATMIDLNYKVDNDGADPRKVAEDFLKEKGLIK